MGSCISKNGRTSSNNSERGRSMIAQNNSNNDILNSFNNETSADQRTTKSKKKSKSKRNNNLKSCVKCTKNIQSSTSSLSSTSRSTGNHRRRNNRNYHDNNNLDLDYETSDNDEEEDDDEENEESSIVFDDILNAIREVVINNNGDEPPSIIIEMQRLASNEKGWIKIMIQLVNRIELDDPIGPSIITLFLDEFPIPTPDSIELLVKKMPINKQNVSKNKERNCLVIFSCLGEKIAGPSSRSLMTNETLDFVFSKLKHDPYFDNTKTFTKDDIATLTVMVFSLIALEKFAISTENKLKIMEKLNNYINPLVELSKWNNDKHYLKRQIGFNSLFLLDNAFPTFNHKYGYETVDVSNINAKLNDKDASEYLKLSSNGLEARNDTLSFESVRCTFQCDTGIWYYEVTVLSRGVMQIGFATKLSKFLNYNGFGIGDDEYSVAYDGCRRFVWYNAEPRPHDHRAWREGDVVGLLLDLNNYEIIFYLNGEPLQCTHTKIFESAKTGFFAAASFISFQHCLFNFGREPFKYPPKNYIFKSFNDFGELTETEKIILPRRKKLDILRETALVPNACSLCCDNISTVMLIPCNHKDFCKDCANRLASCPVCRSNIISIKNI